jgi:peptidoglycan/xylan/chitin deacetylase (PgdA/CDA1 family)
MRHDVDFDVSLAHRLASIEARNDVRSTYFFLTTSATYNLLATQNRQLVAEMAGMGFEIGLHFDPTVYGSVPRNVLQRRVEVEADLLSEIAGREVRSVSLHNPSVHGEFPIFRGFTNAYDPEIFDDSCYISDSQMDFRNKDLRTFVERVSERTVQILTHPMHYSEDGSGYLGIVHRHVDRYLDMVHGFFSVNATYRREVGSSLVDGFVKSHSKGKE